MSPQSPKRFVILGNQRSRSTLLVQLLDRHPEVVCHGELFCREFFTLSNKLDEVSMLNDLGATSTRDVESRDRDRSTFLEQVIDSTRAAQTPDLRWVGHKLLRETSDGILNDVLMDTEVVKLVLIRNDVFGVTSKLIAQLSKDWARRPGEPEQPQSLHLDPGDFTRVALANRYFLDTVLTQLAATGQRFLIVFSEDVPTQSGQDEICSFLGISMNEVETRTTYQPQNSTSIEERIENFDEFRYFLQGTLFEECLAEDRTIDRDRWLSYCKGPTERSRAVDQKLREIAAFSRLEWRVLNSSLHDPDLVGSGRLAAAWRALIGR